MASRKEQKEAARERRLADERAAALEARKKRRLQLVGGTVAAAIVVAVVLIIVSSSGGGHKAKAVAPTSPQARHTDAQVTTLLRNIPQHGNVLGNPHARVTMIEYADLVCPYCQQFALGGEQQFIANEVRQGKVKLEYRAYETASRSANDAMFVPGQAAALAAGEQDREWNFILTWYHEQQDETTSYVTSSFLQGIAQQVPGLDVAKWSSARNASSLADQVNADNQTAVSADYGGTPTVIFQGPVSQSKPLGVATYSQLQSALKSVA